MLKMLKKPKGSIDSSVVRKKSIVPMKEKELKETLTLVGFEPCTLRPAT